MTALIDTSAASQPFIVAAKPSLAGLDRAGLSSALSAVGVPERQVRMRVEQLWHWIYVRGATSFEACANMAKELRATLAASYTLDRPEIVTQQVSVDGTRKWLVRLPPDGPGQRGHDIEMVYIPEAGRGTLCVSSQVGCTLNCSFCHTGTQKLVRNLTAAEIVMQLLIARDDLNDYVGRVAADGAIVPREGSRYVSNVVFMGMGEPLYNLDEVATALDVMSDGDGLSISRRRITVSTSGVVPEMAKLGSRTSAMLAVSLHATMDPLRDELVPLNKKYPIGELLAACKAYPGASNARRITFEYVMLKGANDTTADARRLVKLLAGVPAKINLIPFNPWPGTRYECSDWDVIERFSDIVFQAGYSSPVRTPRGRDIFAACGQLKSETEKLSVRQRERLSAMAAMVAGQDE
jgi:23S rRNA (adenine2503-C2)-methyltransferase